MTWTLTPPARRVPLVQAVYNYVPGMNQAVVDALAKSVRRKAARTSAAQSKARH